MSIYTFRAPTIADCTIEANDTIPGTEKIESVDVLHTGVYPNETEYVMVVVTNNWYHYAKYTKGN